MSDRPRRSRVVRALIETTVAIAIIVGTLLSLEGIASGLLFVREVRAPVAASIPLHRPHAVHDTLLGWRNEANVARPDEYGSGVALTTTAEGFRSTHLADVAETPGQPAIVCSGDAFTFGVGVADDRTWCALLQRELSGVRTIDMAQDFYGLDQVYLWYRREAPRVPHAVQILAVTSAELERSIDADDAGWLKPQLALADGKLATTHVPVPEQTAGPLRDFKWDQAVGDLRVVQAVRRIDRFDPDNRTAWRVTQEQPVLTRIIGELQALHRAQGTRLVVVYLPTSGEARRAALDARRAWLARVTTEQGIPFFDLTHGFRALRRDSLDLAYLVKGSPLAAPRATGQYSTVGHAWIARTLAADLATLPAFPGRLAGAPAAGAQPTDSARRTPVQR